MKKLAALIVLALAGSSLAMAASPDRAFYLKAAAGGMAEVEAGKLAQQKGTSEAVKNFGAKMVEDHTAANEKLMALAASKKIKLPKELDAKHKAKQKNLEAKSGSAFDAAYIKAQIADHKATIALLEREIASGKDAEAKAFATETLPTVKEHLTMLQAMSGAPASGENRGVHSGAHPGAGTPGGTPSGTGAQSPAASPLGTGTR